jgi:dienelactone hydrolase
VGYFGASTGGGAALAAAAERPEAVGAVVSRGGRPDLAGPALGCVRAPTLLVVGGRDVPVIALNREALAQLRCAARMEIIPGATHLFEEPGTLGEVARLAGAWFTRHLGPAGSSSSTHDCRRRSARRGRRGGMVPALRAVPVRRAACPPRGADADPIPDRWREDSWPSPRSPS